MELFHFGSFVVMIVLIQYPGDILCGRLLDPTALQEVRSHKVTTKQDMVQVTLHSPGVAIDTHGVSVHKQTTFPQPATFTPPQMQAILDVHNGLRSQEKASNMYYLVRYHIYVSVYLYIYIFSDYIKIKCVINRSVSSTCFNLGGIAG